MRGKPKQITFGQAENIARRLNKEIGKISAITPMQVQQIDAGIDNTPSHPVWQKIKRAIQNQKHK